ncbi:hypothetical protein Rsub_00282 [Raphidocelis subcapitata]|uniref:Uncharacterized protein n=1 Tax=Raphidocelis subcapitata TaxID=307507 RepID=A0A2V0NJY6_9CHLO|nr:hypothetical protein Rsub_00282 [Raphidocelis subcapitata]|eukprot:GBF87571.1 hypothetical protein Rsub_00282 [Raphidocelis subcapitata]
MQRLLRALQAAFLAVIATMLCCGSGAQARRLRSSGGGPIGAELAAPRALGIGTGRHLLGSGYLDSWSSRELPVPRDVPTYSPTRATPQSATSYNYQSGSVPAGRMNGPIMDSSGSAGGAWRGGASTSASSSSSSGWGGYPQPYGGRR